ncbi:acidic fibroblast growth factor intracellular-binding protein-like [Lineus longissimus]|uniref:acidic fibroblast growth factor intracellular-binding protein-like n=1 Tax=Lineus longissimus TaxID=88925 RepID=UPI002B4E35CC
MTSVDLFVGNNTLIDPELYSLWLNGHSVQDAAAQLKKRGILQEYHVTHDVLISDVQDHYRTFSMLERWLHSPPKLIEQMMFQLDPDIRKMLIEKYYEFDPLVVRELLGKKLTSKQRKDLDDVSEKTKVLLRSCRRQFDNVKRVFKTVEDMMGSLEENIKNRFLLSDVLAKKYAAIVFLANNRFETGKKKLFYLQFDDFAFCANTMITNWSYSSVDCKDHADMDVDFDVKFFHSLRELKVLAEKDALDEHRNLVCQQLKPQLRDKVSADLESNFKNMSRFIITIATNLIHTKEVRDFFVDIIDKLIEPLRQSGWDYRDVSLFLDTYADACRHMDAIVRHNPPLLKTWDRYIKTVKVCVLRMYHT